MSVFVRRAILALGVFFVSAAAIPAWNSVRVAAYLSQARGKMDDPEAAVLPLLEAVSLAPDRADVQFLLGKVQRRLGRFDKSTRHLNRARSLGWPEEDVSREELLIAIQGGDIDRVTPEIQRLTTGDTPDDVAEEVYEALVKGYIGTYREMEAINTLNLWIEWRPQSQQPRLWLAEIWERLLKPEEAMVQYREILSWEPDCAEARVKLARILMQRNQVDEALAEFQKCVIDDPQRRPDLELGIAECEHRLGASAEAAQRIEEVLRGELAPMQEQRAMTLLCRVLIENADNVDDTVFERVVEMGTRAAQLDPTSPDACYFTGMAMHLLGRTKEGEEFMDRHRKLQAQGRRIAEITRELIRSPADTELRYELAMILLEQGSLQESQLWLETVLNYDSQHAKAHRALADGYKRIGNSRLAARHEALARQYGEPPAGDSEAPEGAADATSSSGEGGGNPAGAGAANTDAPTAGAAEPAPPRDKLKSSVNP